MIRQYILPSLALAAPAAAEAATDGAALPADLSVWGMFAQADWVVKLVMLGLVVASIVTWTVLVAKHLELARQRKDAEAFRDRLAATRSLAQLDGTALQHPIVQEAREELAQSDGSLADGEGLKERLVSRLDRYEAKVARKMTQGVTILGTIGATAPFVGLFGTVWGIMNAFINIAEKQDTSLTNVAGPIAEALFATGLGLIAAIPAVIFYNKFTGDLNQFADRLDTFSQDLLVRLSRRSTDGGA